MTEPVYTEFPIVFEDAHLVLINKPSGILSHPNPVNEKRKLEGQEGRAAFLGHYDFEQRTFETPKGPIWLLHRLDQEASGVLLAAKSAATAAALRVMFDKQSLQKIYHVMVGNGQPRPTAGKWHDHIDARRKAGLRRAYIKQNQPTNAILSYTVAENFPEAKMAMLAIKLVTGRLHQIRVQCAAHDHPVAGDRLYGDFQWNRMLQKVVGLRRLFLHAASLAFQHPVTKEQLKVEAPLSPELQEVVHQLRNAQAVGKDKGSRITPARPKSAARKSKHR